MKKLVLIDNKGWHNEVVMFLRSKNIAWETPSGWQYAAMGLLFAIGFVIGYLA
jgi:hypothetical protein